MLRKWGGTLDRLASAYHHLNWQQTETRLKGPNVGAGSTRHDPDAKGQPDEGSVGIFKKPEDAQGELVDSHTGAQYVTVEATENMNVNPVGGLGKYH